jgi:type I restriction enzyme S subunit
MSKWKKCLFKEVVQFPPKVILEKGKSYSFIPMEDINGSFKYVSPLTEKTWTGSSGTKFENGDTLFARITPCLQNGKIAQVKDLKQGRGFGSTEYFIFRGIDEVSDSDFVYYLSQVEEFRKYAIGSMVGASGRQRADASFVGNYEIHLPPLPTQRRIASILSAYDDLIENNLKRIKLLEELAQRTYEEWFVKFRINGEPLPIDEKTGLPEGWERKKLFEIADIKWGDTSVTKSSYCKKGFLAYSASGPDGLLDYYDYDKSGIVLSAIGAYAGLTWLALGKWSAIKNTMVFWSKQKSLSNHYLFLATKGMNYWNRRGAAQPFIAQGDAKLQQILLPNEDINIKFSKKVEPIYEVIYKLNANNKLLKESRDILLQRLMSGKINVE